LVRRLDEGLSSFHVMKPRRQKLALAAVLLLTAVVYARGLHGEFQFDDRHTIQWNQKIRDIDGFLHAPPILEILRGDRVLTNLTFALNYRMGGLDP
jgi:hypothetical protein